MHRGGLDRTSTKTKLSPAKGSFPGGPRGHKLPTSMATIPVIEADGRADVEAPLLGDGEKSGHSSGTASRSVVQLQASAGLPAGGGMEGPGGLPGGGGEAAFRRAAQSPKPSTATRRKAAEANNPFG